ncbi:MAG: hypothetical protein KAS32_03095 [Candidatus Peribacteraceae bacterium]|nr:hypothetical protein [Candidatus Peribacteraceae bacterium]
MWLLGEIHPLYGEVVACGCGIGGAWRMFDNDGVVSLIPLDVLNSP